MSGPIHPHVNLFHQVAFKSGTSPASAGTGGISPARKGLRRCHHFFFGRPSPPLGTSSNSCFREQSSVDADRSVGVAGSETVDFSVMLEYPLPLIRCSGVERNHEACEVYYEEDRVG